MVQVLPRYCLRCSTPTQEDMQRCATCDLSIEAMLSCPEDRQSETNEYNDAALQGAIAPTPRFIQQEVDEFLPTCQPDWNAPDESAQPPRFPPASSLPPEPDQWNDQGVQQRWFAQQVPRFAPTQPLTSEPWNDPDLTYSPDNPAILSTEAMPSRPEDKQSETSEHDAAALQKAIAPTPRLIQQEDDAFLPTCQPDWNAPDESAQPPRFPPASSLPPEPDQWNDQGMQQRWSAQQVPCFAPTQLLTSEPWNDPDLAYLPDNPAILSIEARPEDRQSETSEHDAAALQKAIAPTPRLIQQEDDAFLPTCQPGWNTPGESAQLPQLLPTSPLAPGAWNAPRGRWLAGIVFIGLAVLFLLTGGGGYIIFSNYLSGLSSSQALVQATATAKAESTNPYVSSSTLVFSDTLKAANSNWDQNTGCAFNSGSYHVTTTMIQSCTLNANVTLTNFVLEVKVTLLQGDVAGFFFRENKLHDRSDAYLLDFDSKGKYQLWNRSASRPAKMMGYGFSSDLSTGYNQTNIIALVVQGSSITLYVNRHMVKHVIDSTYSSGGLSLISSEYAQHTGVSEAAYSDLRLWQL